MQDSQLRWMIGLSLVVLVLVGLLSLEPADSESAQGVEVWAIPDVTQVVEVRISRERDQVHLVQTVLQTDSGDADLNGVFDSSDLVLIFLAGEYEDTIPGNSGWRDARRTRATAARSSYSAR